MLFSVQLSPFTQGEQLFTVMSVYLLLILVRFSVYPHFVSCLVYSLEMPETSTLLRRNSLARERKEEIAEQVRIIQMLF